MTQLSEPRKAIPATARPPAGTPEPAGAPARPKDPRVIALRNFCISITALNVFGYAWFGFEQPWLWPIVAVLVAYTMELGLETLGARAEQRPPRYAGRGFRGLVEFLYPAHITALAVNMLIYANDRIAVMIFGVVAGISGKWLLRVPVKGRVRHFMNPSNLGITAILLLFPWVSVAPPYQFTEYLSGAGDWIVPAVILAAGTMLNGMLTKRLWLIGGWLVAFALQAVVRGLIFDISIPAALATMTGVAFVLFTNYMITDPGTTPFTPASQVAFGAGAALIYGALTALHVVYGLFFATVLVCLVRGSFLWALHRMSVSAAAHNAAPDSARTPASPALAVRP